MTTIVYPLPLDLPERLEKMAKWCQQFSGPQSLTGETWHDAADSFFSRFAPDTLGGVTQSGDWIPVDLAEHTGRSERFKLNDMVFKFFEREKGRYGVRLVGTVNL